MFFLTKTLLGAFFALPLIVNGKCVTLVDEMGQRYPLTINEKQLEGAIEEISLYTNTDQDATLPISFNFLVTDQEIIVHPQKSHRNYHAKVTPREKKDIDFLVTKMAWEKNPKKLWDLEKEMNQAGERIINLHPFKFLEVICTDEKLCAGLKAIRSRNILIWPRFVKGSVTSLKEEQTYNNVLPYVQNFAETIGVDIHLLLPLAKNQKWEELVKTVADKVVRPNTPNRYDM